MTSCYPNLINFEIILHHHHKHPLSQSSAAYDTRWDETGLGVSWLVSLAISNFVRGHLALEISLANLPYYELLATSLVYSLCHFTSVYSQGRYTSLAQTHLLGERLIEITIIPKGNLSFSDGRINLICRYRIHLRKYTPRSVELL
jgi:hypothetical protein